MALSYSILAKDVFDRVHLVQITFDSSYATGGESVDANSCGMNNIAGIVCSKPSTGTYDVYYDISAAKLVAINSTTGVEVANATDLSTVVVQCTVYAKI